VSRRILFISCGDNGLFGLRHLVSLGHTISAVVTIPPELGEKYNVSGYCDFSPFCEQQGLRLISLDSYTLQPSHLEGVEFDLIVVNGWNRLIRSDVIAMARLGGLGVHAGHPPIGLGRAPLVWNILLGRTDIEVYVFRLTPNADDGDIVVTRVVEITPCDTVKLLYEKVMLAAAEMFAVAVGHVHNRLPTHPQDLTSAVHYAKRSPEDGQIDFSQSETRIYDFVRAQVPPYPGAFTWLDGEKWTVLEALPFDRFAFRDVPRVPGTILCVLPSGPVVQTGGAPVWITKAEVGNQQVLAGRFDELGLRPGKRFLRRTAEKAAEL
jgi:methionyl-tRNA formyltransferase